MKAFLCFWTLSTSCSFHVLGIFLSRDSHRLEERIKLNHCCVHPDSLNFKVLCLQEHPSDSFSPVPDLNLTS